MKKLLLTLVSLLGMYIGSAQDPLSTKDSTAIVKVLEDQRLAWNHGDIAQYMQGYWKSEQLVFNGASGPIFGWENTKQRYLKGYPDTTAMGKLTFTVIRLQPVTDGVAQMIGKFDLQRTIGDLSGYFTLNWKKFDQGWLIISDHTSGSN